jgi:hypothetical protein
MKIKESVLREKINRILCEEQLKYTSLRGANLSAEADESRGDSGEKVFSVKDPAVSYFLHDITEPDSILSYISWRVVFEELLYKNLNGNNLNADKRNHVFSDVTIAGVHYSVKSTTLLNTTDSTAVKNSPSLTIPTILSRQENQKYGIIVGRKVGNDLKWTRYGEIKTGKQLQKSLKFLEYLEDRGNKGAQDALKQLRGAKNPRYVVKFFFDPSEEIVNAQEKYEKNKNETEPFAASSAEALSADEEATQINVKTNLKVRQTPMMTVKLGEKILPDDLQYDGKAVQVSYIISRLAKLNEKEIEEVISLVTRKSDIDPA